MGTAVGDGVMAFADVVVTVGGDAPNLLIGRNLVEEFGQGGRVANLIAGELGGPDLQRLLTDRDVELALSTAVRTAVLVCVPFAFTLDLDAGAVDWKIQGALRASIGDADLQGLLAAAERAKVGH